MKGEQAHSEGPFRPYGRGPSIWRPQIFFALTYYSFISVNPIIKQQEKILTSFAENLNVKPRQAVELSSNKTFYKIEMIIISKIIWIEYLSLIRQTSLVLEVQKRPSTSN